MRNIKYKIFAIHAYQLADKGILQLILLQLHQMSRQSETSLLLPRTQDALDGLAPTLGRHPKSIVNWKSFFI